MHKTCVIARGGEAPGTPVFPFSFPARSEGMERREGARGPAKPPLAGLAKPAARLARRARLWAKRRCAPLALHPQSSGRSLRRLDCGGAHCRRAAPCSSSNVTRDDARCRTRREEYKCAGARGDKLFSESCRPVSPATQGASRCLQRVARQTIFALGSSCQSVHADPDYPCARALRRRAGSPRQPILSCCRRQSKPCTSCRSGIDGNRRTFLP